MKANIEGITLAISRKEGIELRNQIIKLMGGDTMPIHAVDFLLHVNEEDS